MRLMRLGCLCLCHLHCGAVSAAVLHGDLVRDHTAACTGGALLTKDFKQAGAHSLARHLNQAQRGDLGDLVLGPVTA